MWKGIKEFFGIYDKPAVSTAAVAKPAKATPAKAPSKKAVKTTKTKKNAK